MAGVKRPFKLMCIEIVVDEDDSYEDVCRYGGTFKSHHNARAAAKRWAEENDYMLSDFEFCRGYSIKISVRPYCEAAEARAKAFREYCNRKQSCGPYEQPL